MNAAQITWAKRFDVIDVVTPNGRREPVCVFSRCGRVGVGYYCTTHQLHLANIGNAVIHVTEDAGPHHLAVHCDEHGYEACDEQQMRARFGVAA